MKVAELRETRDVEARMAVLPASICEFTLQGYDEPGAGPRAEHENETCVAAGALMMRNDAAVNPAVRSAPSALIYGMPVLNVDEARQVLLNKRAMRPGLAGIENQLHFEPYTTLLMCHARDSKSKLLAAVKAL